MTAGQYEVCRRYASRPIDAVVHAQKLRGIVIKLKLIQCFIYFLVDG